MQLSMKLHLGNLYCIWFRDTLDDVLRINRCDMAASNDSTRRSAVRFLSLHCVFSIFFLGLQDLWFCVRSCDHVTWVFLALPNQQVEDWGLLGLDTTWGANDHNDHVIYSSWKSFGKTNFEIHFKTLEIPYFILLYLYTQLINTWEARCPIKGLAYTSRGAPSCQLSRNLPPICGPAPRRSLDTGRLCWRASSQDLAELKTACPKNCYHVSLLVQLYKYAQTIWMGILLIDACRNMCIYVYSIHTNVYLPSVICNLNLPHHDESNVMLHNILFHIMRDHVVPYHIRSYPFHVMSHHIMSDHFWTFYHFRLHITQQVHLFHFSKLFLLTRISPETSPFRSIYIINLITRCYLGHLCSYSTSWYIHQTNISNFRLQAA